MLNKNNQILNKGFSLIEIMISTAIFTFVMVVAIGAFMTSSHGAKESKALRVAMDNINFAMDNVTRELRVGSSYNDNSPKSQISFQPYDLAVPRRYFYLNSLTSSIDKCDLALPPDPNAVCAPLTSPEVEITDLEFTVYNDTNVASGTQPSVYIEMEGQVTINNITESFDLNTLASQRNAE